MSCICIPPFSATPDDLGCIFVLTSSTQGSSSTLTVSKSSTEFEVYGRMGTIFYENITNLNFPITSSATTTSISTQSGTPLFNTTFFVDSSGKVLDLQLGGPGSGESVIPSNTGLPLTFFGPKIFPSLNNTSTVWGTSSSIGRLNYCGVWPTVTNPAPPLNEWIGFTSCINTLSAQTFYVGIASNDFFRIKLNGDILVESNLSLLTNGLSYYTYPLNYSTWSVFPITLSAGENYIELEGRNSGGTASFGAEIYSGDIATLSAITSQSVLSAYTIFSTANLTGLTFDNAGSSGLTCPENYVLNSCGAIEYCVRVYRNSCYIPPSSTTTTTTQGAYLRENYIPATTCDIFSISPMTVICTTTNVTGKTSNGTASLNISGGTPPYTIRWTYPNGTIRVTGSSFLPNLGVGTYTATVTDYYGDFIVTTSCIVGRTTTTTTTSTTTLPPPNADDFCLTIKSRNIKGGINSSNPFYFQDTFTPTIIGSTVTFTSLSGNEYIYKNTNLNLWILSASTTSILYSSNVTGTNSSTLPYFDSINNPGYVGWTINSPFPNSSSANVGFCS